LALTVLIDGQPISSDEIKGQMKILRNKDHFKQSDVELQLMIDDLKNSGSIKRRLWGKREE